MNKLLATGIFFILALLLVQTVHASEVIISQSQYDLNLVAGDTEVIEVSLTWTGTTAEVGFLQATISPEGEGIYISFSENPLILFPNIEKTIDMTIDTDMRLQPGIYTIGLSANIYSETTVEWRTQWRTRTETQMQYQYVDNQSLLQNVYFLLDELNTTRGVSNLTIDGLKAELLSLIDEYNDFRKDYTNLENDYNAKVREDNSMFALIIFFAIIFIVLTAVITYSIYLHKKQKLAETIRKEIEEEKQREQPKIL